MTPAQVDAVLRYYWKGGTERQDPMEALALLDAEKAQGIVVERVA